MSNNLTQGETMTTTDVKIAREVDGRLAELHDRRYRISRHLNSVLDTLKHWGMSVEDARANSSMTRRVESIDKWTAELDEIGVEIDAAEADYTGWTRFFFVQHLHNTTECSSFRWNTRIVWYRDLRSHRRRSGGGIRSDALHQVFQVSTSTGESGLAPAPG